MFEFLLQHQFWAAVGAYWIFSAAVSAMPEPVSGSGAGYRWLYRFLHTTAGNITTALSTAARCRACASPLGNRIPGLKIVIPLLLVPLVLSMPACAAVHYTVHPGAMNQVDSVAYDTLLIAETTIDQGRSAYQAGRLPVAAKDTLNALVEAYNVARVSWLTYRGAIATNVPADPYFQELNKNLADLANAIRNLQRKEAKP
jgi:hypothetical protein